MEAMERGAARPPRALTEPLTPSWLWRLSNLTMAVFFGLAGAVQVGSHAGLGLGLGLGRGEGRGGEGKRVAAAE